MSDHETLLVRNGNTVKHIISPQSYGITPAIVLMDPKYAHNIGAAVRLAACYQINQVWYVGNRITLMGGRDRLPREERMRSYANVTLLQYDRPFEQFKKGTPVGVEMRLEAESLNNFEHPKDAIYVFGPEDGSLGRVTLSMCHRFVSIPTRHCLNLGAAIATVLYDRQTKS